MEVTNNRLLLFVSQKSSSPLAISNSNVVNKTTPAEKYTSFVVQHTNMLTVGNKARKAIPVFTIHFLTPILFKKVII